MAVSHPQPPTHDTQPITPPVPDPTIFSANIAALEAFLPTTAEYLRTATPPASIQFVAGRDASPTFAWTDEQDRLHWLGRTSMPSVSGPALVDAFEPGERNVLLCGFGQGGEVRLLLQRLAPYQAVMAVDECAWAVSHSLRLYNFADDLRNGRLLLFVGPDAWKALRDFLLDHDGTLTPERVLSWPWFDPGMVTNVTNHLSAIGSEVSMHRASKHAELRRARAEDRGSSGEHSIAIVSNVAEARIRTFAHRLKVAADSLGRHCVSFVLDSPATVHPHAIESALWEASPELLVLLDVAPDALQYELPPAPKFVVCTHRQPIATSWLKRLPSSVKLGVMTEQQRAKAVESGFDTSRLLLLPPAAMAGLVARTSPDRQPLTTRGKMEDSGSETPLVTVTTTGETPVPQYCHGPSAVSDQPSAIIVIAGGCDATADAVGLHLASHRALWEAAARILRTQCDTYHDDRAEAVLREAEKELRIELDSQEVRRGLVTRIREILGPAVVRRAHCLALAEARIEFDLFGGWRHDPILGKYDRGRWPADCGLAIAECGLGIDGNLQSAIGNRKSALSGRGLIISIESSGLIRSALLDGIACGLAAAVRSHPSDRTPAGLSTVLDPIEHVWRFESRQALVELVRKFQDRPAAFQQRAATATRHINAHHTWTSRLTAIVQSSIPDP